MSMSSLMSTLSSMTISDSSSAVEVPKSSDTADPSSAKVESSMTVVSISVSISVEISVSVSMIVSLSSMVVVVVSDWCSCRWCSIPVLSV